MKEKIKVVIMIPSALTDRWQGMYCIDALSEKFDLEYWDCSAICKPAFDSSTSLERDYVKTIHNTNEMEENLKQLPQDTVIFSQIHLEGYNYALHQLISKYNRNRVYTDFWANRVTAFIQQQSQIQQRSNKVKKIEGVFKKIPSLFYIYKYIELGGGDKFRSYWDEYRKLKRYYRAVPLYNRFLLTVTPRKEYSINHPDYEKYLSIAQKKEEPLVEGKYIVFLDQCFPVHPTLKSENPDVDFQALARPYYDSLNHFFRKVEKQYGCEVVVAGHPIANYEINPFDGRKIFYFKTAELVSSASAVMLHCSFSISFPILFNKPVCLIANEPLMHATEIKENINRFSIVFNKQVIDTDTVKDAKDVFKPIDEEIRKRYINTFFDTSVKEKNSEIFANHIRNIHDKILANDKMRFNK